MSHWDRFMEVYCSGSLNYMVAHRYAFVNQQIAIGKFLSKTIFR